MLSFFEMINGFLVLLELATLVFIFKKYSSPKYNNKRLTIYISSVVAFIFFIVIQLLIYNDLFNVKWVERFDDVASAYGAKYSFAGFSKAKYVKDNFTFTYDVRLNDNNEKYSLITDSIDMDRSIHYAFVRHIAEDLKEEEFNTTIEALIKEANETKKEVSITLNKEKANIIFTYDPVNDKYKCEMYEKIR